MNRDSWIDAAACREMDHSVFFPTGLAEFQVKAREKKVATEICGPCPVRLPCLMDAVKMPAEDDVGGVRGGMNADERKEFRIRQEIKPTKQRPILRGEQVLI